MGSVETTHDTAAPDRATCTREYASRFSGPIGEWFLEVQERMVLDMLDDLAPGSIVLDVGGGHGQLAPRLADAGFRVVVLGSAPECRRLIRSRLRSSRIGFAVVPFHRLPFPDGAADAVVSVRMLAHIRDWRRFVGEMCRVSSGPVVMDFPARRSVNVASSLLYSLKNRVEDDTTRPFRTVGRAEVEGAVRASGFRLSRAAAQYLWPMALHRALGRRGLARLIEAPFRTLGITDRVGSPVLARAEPAQAGDPGLQR